MNKISVITSNNRGFLRNLFDYKFDNVIFLYKKDNIYEIPNKIHSFLSKLIKLKIFDYLGVFQIPKALGVEGDICISYNRFLITDKPYYIILENPSALVNYCWDRPKYIIAKKRIKNNLNNPNLKGIICISDACYKYFGNLYEVPKCLNLKRIYPLILDDYSYSESNIEEKISASNIECLYISSDFELKGGRDILEVFKKLQDLRINLTIITREKTIRQDDLKLINKFDTIKLVEFALTKQELNEYYKKAAILLNPTRIDSFSLVTLEAIKYGCSIIATDIYAIKEMVINGFNGYLEQPMYTVWDDDGTLNKYYRTHMKQTLLSGVVDNKLVDKIVYDLTILYNDRKKLKRMCQNSLSIARNESFSEQSIINQWKMIFDEV